MTAACDTDTTDLTGVLEFWHLGYAAGTAGDPLGPVLRRAADHVGGLAPFQKRAVAEGWRDGRRDRASYEQDMAAGVGAVDYDADNVPF